MTVTPRPTPNPDSLKFEVEGGTITGEKLLAYHSAREAAGDALGAALFAIRGVETLLIVPSFVTVTKHPAADWDLLISGVEQVLREHLGRTVA
jgi:hypothetical protein